MSFKGITFDLQSPTAKNHGALFKGILTDGVLSGCNVTFSNGKFYVAAGYIIAAGRELQITSTEQISVTATSGYARLKLRLNMNGAATKERFEQASFEVEYSSSESFPALVKNDINANGTVYEVEFATLRLADSTLTVKVGTPHAPALITDRVYTELPAASTVAEGELIFVGG